MEFEKFKYKNLEEIKEDLKKNNLDLNTSENFSVLNKEILIGNKKTHNAFVVHPMEGCDSELDGKPSELTIRRYKRFAEGGSGIIWFEAIAVKEDGRNFPNQLLLNEENFESFKKLISDTKKWHKDKFGKEVLCIAQLTHSGRFSKPNGYPEPIYPVKSPLLDEKPVDCRNFPVVTDEYLDDLQNYYVEAGKLAEKAGFDGLDIKACHKYLVSELLGSFLREGKYGGSFENRTRFLIEVVEKVKENVSPEILMCCRLNFTDAMDYPHGFGVDKNNPLKPDFSETIELIKILQEKGVKLINATMGSPYYEAHINRPYDQGNYIPNEHPLVGTERLINGIAEVQKAVPNMAIIGTGYSWLREYIPYFASSALEEKKSTLIGLGRQSFAYPNFVADLIETGKVDPKKCCIACSKCAVLLRNGVPSGCLIKDSEVYGKIYKERIK